MYTEPTGTDLTYRVIVRASAGAPESAMLLTVQHREEVEQGVVSFAADVLASGESVDLYRTGAMTPGLLSGYVGQGQAVIGVWTATPIVHACSWKSAAR